MINYKNFEDMIEHYNSKIQFVIKKFNKSESDIEDIKQEVYIKAWKNLPKFNDHKNPWGLINKITVNTCIDHFRSNKKRQLETSTEQAILENIPCKTAEFDKKIILTERHKIILNAINKLNSKFREVIILHDIEEMTYEEISKKLNCPLGTIKSRLFNARKLLREDLQDLLN